MVGKLSARRARETQRTGGSDSVQGDRVVSDEVLFKMIGANVRKVQDAN